MVMPSVYTVTSSSGWCPFILCIAVPYSLGKQTARIYASMMVTDINGSNITQLNRHGISNAINSQSYIKTIISFYIQR